MAFQWENHIAYGSLVTLQRLVEAFALDREGTGVVVQFTMNEQQGTAQLISIHERRHGVVHFRSFPVSTGFCLEAERSQSTVVRTATSDTRLEQLGMGQQVTGHETAIRVTTYTYTFRVAHAHVGNYLDGCFGVHNQLFDVCVVRFLVFGTYNRHFHIFHHAITLCYPENR